MNFKFKNPPYYFFIILWIISIALVLQFDKKIQGTEDTNIYTQIINNLPNVWNRIHNKKVEFKELEKNSIEITVTGGPFSDQNLLDFIVNLNKISIVEMASLVTLKKSESLDPSSWSFTIRIHLLK